MSKHAISVFHKIIIYLEDCGQSKLENLYALGSKRVVVGSLGRLEALGLVERNTAHNEIQFSLSKLGDEFLTSQLVFLPTENSKPTNTWYISIFQIPEEQRTARYSAKSKLQELGASMIQPGVWITPIESAAQEFSDYFEQTYPKIPVHIFKSESLNGFSGIENVGDLERDYQDLFTFFENHYKTIKSKPNASYEAKCALLMLSNVIKQDHSLYMGKQPKNWIGNQSKTWYTKYRKLINTY